MLVIPTQDQFTLTLNDFSTKHDFLVQVYLKNITANSDSFLLYTSKSFQQKVSIFTNMKI
jgi:hypothetical protein